MTDIRTLDIKGLTCGHCVAAVTRELEAVDGVDSVAVNLVPDEDAISTATVTTSSDVSETQLRSAVDEAGYDLIAIH